MLDILIHTIPHEDQAYPTIGNYESVVPGMEKQIELTPGQAIITVSDMGNWKAELLVAIHELIEVATACWVNGIPDSKIVAFDKLYEKLRESGMADDEPGNDPTAPYYTYHQLAMFVEAGLLPHFKLSEYEYMDLVDKTFSGETNDNQSIE